LASSSGAAKKGEWLVSMVMTFSHGKFVYIFLCNAGVSALSCKQEIKMRGILPKFFGVVSTGVAKGVTA
jgi:hypothetical protein